MSEAETFLTLLQAAMYDALEEMKLTQLFLTLESPKGVKGRVRVIIVPEKMEYNFEGAQGSGKTIAPGAKDVTKAS